MTQIKDLLPQPHPNEEVWTRNAFTALLKHRGEWVDKQDALQRYEPIRAILGNVVDFLDYCVKSMQAGISPTPHSAREYARFREDLTAIDSEPEIE